MITHLNKNNKPRIVDINSKKNTKRSAKAEGKVTFSKKVFDKITKMQNKKGEIINISILAGIIGAKKTSELIPLCHNIGIENVDITTCWQSHVGIWTSQILGGYTWGYSLGNVGMYWLGYPSGWDI